ncbi:hypothetical protein KA111_00800 [Candidatus Woesebacteria bacterium]|nr:hypothetical protein [Candidatus Woesebacteria bacterium]
MNLNFSSSMDTHLLIKWNTSGAVMKIIQPTIPTENTTTGAAFSVANQKAIRPSISAVQKTHHIDAKI